MTDAMAKELRWIAEHNGEGVIDQYGRFLAGGQLRGSIYSGSWLRLVAHGYLVGFDGRLVVSEFGKAWIRVHG